VNIMNFGTLHARGKLATGRWGGGACIIFDGRVWRRRSECGMIGGMVFSSGTMTGCHGAAVWIVDCRKTEIPLICAEHYGNGPLAVEGCEDLNIGIVAGLAGARAQENETIDINGFNQRLRIGTVIGTSPSEEVLDLNNSPNCTVEKVVGYGDPRHMSLVGMRIYPCMREGLTLKPYIGHSNGSVVKRKEVVNKKVKAWKRITEVPKLPESLPRFAVKAKLIAVFEDGSEQVAFDETYEFDLSGSEKQVAPDWAR